MAATGEERAPAAFDSEGADWSLTEYSAPRDKISFFDRPTAPKPSRIGKYVILDCIGRGGMGIVYRALHPVSKQIVALKVIIPQQATQAAVDDFLREIQVLARFSHRGIARIFDADTFKSEEKERPYFTMEFIEGAKPVTDYSRDALCDYRRRLEMVLQTASTVAQAHRVKVVHGDLKPTNVLVGLDAEVKVVDFGAAIDAASGNETLHSMTPAYAAPEQLDELRAVPQSDVYSLAVLAYEILTGRLPFEEPAATRASKELDSGRSARIPIPIRALNRTVSTKVDK